MAQGQSGSRSMIRRRAACGVDVACGGGEEFQPQGLGLGDAPGVGEVELLGPGGEVHGEQGDLDRDGVGGGIGVGQVRQSGVFRVLDAVLAAGALVVADFEGG